MAYADPNPDIAQSGDDLAEQLNQTTSEDAGGNVSGTGKGRKDSEFDIVFESEEPDGTSH